MAHPSRHDSHRSCPQSTTVDRENASMTTLGSFAEVAAEIDVIAKGTALTCHTSPRLTARCMVNAGGYVSPIGSCPSRSCFVNGTQRPCGRPPPLPLPSSTTHRQWSGGHRLSAVAEATFDPLASQSGNRGETGSVRQLEDVQVTPLACPIEDSRRIRSV